MNMNSVLQNGGCLCGKIAYEFEQSKVLATHHCHCKDCQKYSVQSTSHQSVLPAFFKGCTSCNNTGFKGRVPVMSHMEMNSENARLLEEDISKLVIEDTLESEALRLYRDGLTSLFEINRLKQHF